MRILPRSLFGRTVLVLMAGLLLAQLISAAILFQERGLGVYHASGLHTAQRITNVVHLLESASPSDSCAPVSVPKPPCHRSRSPPSTSPSVSKSPGIAGKNVTLPGVGTVDSQLAAMLPLTLCNVWKQTRLAYSEPITVPPDLDDEGFEAARRDLEARLTALCDEVGYT